MYGIDRFEQTTLRMKELQPRVPAWAKAEHLEIAASQAELWRFADDPKKKIGVRILEMLANLKSKRR